MKILSIIEGAYRGTLEEQDDAAVWLTHALKNAGADIHVLLRGNAVNYAVAGHDARGIAVGGVAIDHPPALDADLARLAAAGVTVLAVREDLVARGIAAERLAPCVECVDAARIADLVIDHDQILHW